MENFICRNCNSETGSTWDAELARQLEGLTIVLGVQRQKGPPRSKFLSTSSGDEVRLHPGNRSTLAHPTVVREQDGNPVIYRIKAGTEIEVRSIVNDINKRYCVNLDVDGLLAANPIRTEYLKDPMIVPAHVGGPHADRALVKSALALAFETGIDLKEADLGLAYLRDSESEPCFYPYYSKDLVVNRTPGMPLNCVYVTGDPSTDTLLAYVEVYGLVKVVMSLATDYQGDQFTCSYGIDPTNGTEVNVDIDLDSATFRDAKAQMHSKSNQVGRLKCINQIMDKALSIAWRDELDRIIWAAIEEWYFLTVKTTDKPLSVEDKQSLSRHMAHALESFLLHLCRPINLPTGEIEHVLSSDVDELEKPGTGSETCDGSVS